MSSFPVVCPQCAKRLVLKDRSLLGRKGKCPGCGHRFVLTEPKSDAVHPLATGTSPAEASAPRNSPGEPPAVDISIPETELGISVTTPSRRSRSWLPIVVTSMVLLVFGGGVAAIVLNSQRALTPTGQRDAVQTHPVASSPESATNSSAVEQASQNRVGRREPIQLLMVPSGARLIVNFRPADLWNEDQEMTELRACLTENVVAGIEQSLLQITHRRPEQIEELLLAWILGAQGTPPELAAVVHLAEEEKMSDLIAEFGSVPFDMENHPQVYLHGEQAVLIHDSRTLAFTPREMAAELADWRDVPNLNTSDGILTLLEQTDRTSLLTVLLEPMDVSRHIDMLFPESTRDVSRLAASWVGEDTETLAWSLRADGEFSSTFILRSPSTISAETVLETATRRLAELPSAVEETVSRLRPTRDGVRDLIGRLPDMLQAYRQATVSSVELRTVRFTTALPFKAGPNLALAGILMWNESLRVSGTGSSVMADAPDGSAVPMEERLRQEIDAEFNRTPLQEAMDYIAGEINVQIDINGDALKDAGYTKNMPQTFNLGRVPATTAILEILKQYQAEGKEMVLVVDQSQPLVLLTTRKFADAEGQTVFELKP